MTNNKRKGQISVMGIIGVSASLLAAVITGWFGNVIRNENRAIETAEEIAILKTQVAIIKEDVSDTSDDVQMIRSDVSEIKAALGIRSQVKK